MRPALALLALLVALPAHAAVQFTITIHNYSPASWDQGVLAVMPEGIEPDTLLDNGQAPTGTDDQYYTYTYVHAACDPSGEDDGDGDLLISRWSTLSAGVDAWTIGPLAPGAEDTVTITAEPGDVMSFVARATGSGDDAVMMHMTGDPNDQSVDLFDSGGQALATLAFDIGGYDVINCGSTCPPVAGCDVTYGNGVTGAGAGGSQPSDAGGCDALDWYADADGDGFGAPGLSTNQCDPPPNTVANDGDCDDGEAAVNPSLSETPYDGLDNDCDANTPDDDLDGDGYDHSIDCDDDDATVGAAPTWYADSDHDGYGDLDAPTDACTVPTDHVADASDCDDDDADVHPGAEEVCNGVDDDCEGTADIDATDQTTWYQDADGDSHGDAGVSTSACDAPPGFVASQDDCDDSDATIHPGAEEHCDDVDEDCDGVDDNDVTYTDYYPDGDGDGYGDADAMAVNACVTPPNHVADATDCDDGNADVNPGAAEVCNGIDDDCDDAIDEDGGCDTADTGDSADTSDPATSSRHWEPGEGEVTTPGAGCSCSSAPGLPGWFLLPLLIGLPRRRSRA